MPLYKFFLAKFRVEQESGIALIQVLMMSVLLAGAISFSVLQNSKTTQKVAHDIYSQDLRQFVDRVQSVLANQDDCTDVVGGTTGFSTLATGATITPSSLVGTNLKNFLVETNAATSTPRYGAQERISLNNISIARTSNIAATLTLEFTIDDDGVLGIRELSKSIPLVIFGTSTTVTGCHANPDDLVSDAVKRFCQGPGAIYDADTHQCYLIGFNNNGCEVGYYVKGLSYNPSTMMVSPVCESAVGVLTYDTVGCLGKAGSPIGFDASGNLVCDKMTSKYIWPDLIDPYQANLTPEECSSRITRLRFFNNLYVSCATPIPTNTPTSTPTNTNTPLVSPSATASSTPSATPTGATSTPTYTPTEDEPTPTPTAPPACAFSGDPNDIWNVAMPSTFFTNLYSKAASSPSTQYCKTTQWNEVYEANLDLDGLFGSSSYHPYEVLVDECHLAVAIRVIEEGYSTNHNHSHHTNPTHIGCPPGCTGASGHLKFAHSHCTVEIQPEHLGAGKFELMTYYVDLEHATSYDSVNPCADLADTTKRAPNWKIKVEFVHNNPVGTSWTTCLGGKVPKICTGWVGDGHLPASYPNDYYDYIKCMDPSDTTCAYETPYNTNCWNTHYKSERGGVKLYISFNNGTSWTLFAQMSDINRNSTGMPYPFPYGAFEINKP